jgi:hypothetical protein
MGYGAEYLGTPISAFLGMARRLNGGLAQMSKRLRSCFNTTKTTTLDFMAEVRKARLRSILSVSATLVLKNWMLDGEGLYHD